MIEPIFDRPQFKLLPDNMRRQYATIDNGMLVYTNKRDLIRLVQVPAELFSIMAFLNVPVTSGVQLYLDDTAILSRMVFGIVVDDDVLHDLWYVSKVDMRELIRTVS